MCVVENFMRTSENIVHITIMWVVCDIRLKDLEDRPVLPFHCPLILWVVRGCEAIMNVYNLALVLKEVGLGKILHVRYEVIRPAIVEESIVDEVSSPFGCGNTANEN